MKKKSSELGREKQQGDSGAELSVVVGGLFQASVA
jgi:hypothetical protein